MANRQATALYAGYPERGSWGNLIVLGYGEITEEGASLGMYAHLGKKTIENHHRIVRNDRVYYQIEGNDTHDSGILVTPGESISPNRVIGVVGNTGSGIRSGHPGGDGSHLHYQHVEFSVERLNELKASGAITDDGANKIMEAYNDLRGAIARNDSNAAESAYDFVKIRLIQSCFTVNPVTGQYGACP